MKSKYRYAYIDSIEIKMTLEQAQSASHQGRCDEDVQHLLKVPEIAKQLRKISDADLIDALRGYGAWNIDELQNRDSNEARLIWIAACDIAEEEKHK